MAKLFVFNMVSLDGYFEGENHDISWHHVDEEFNEFAIKQLHETQTLLFGHTTYDLMASYWPTKDALSDDTVVANLMNTTEKIVVSHHDFPVNWEHTTVLFENIQNSIETIKETSKKDIAVFGSSQLSVSLLEMKLVDEVRFIFNPVILGKGTPMFKGIQSLQDFHLMNTKTFRSGNILATYAPIYK